MLYLETDTSYIGITRREFVCYKDMINQTVHYEDVEDLEGANHLKKYDVLCCNLLIKTIEKSS